MVLCSNESEHAMATDYDAPRKQEEDAPADSLEALQASRGGNAQAAVIDLDENDTAEGIDLGCAVDDRRNRVPAGIVHRIADSGVDTRLAVYRHDAAGYWS
jgi:hypothetical protein